MRKISIAIVAVAIAGCSGAGAEESYSLANRCVASAEEMVERIGEPDAGDAMQSRLSHFEEIASTFRDEQQEAASSIGRSASDIETDRAGYRETIDDPDGYSTEALGQSIADECVT